MHRTAHKSSPKFTIAFAAGDMISSSQGQSPAASSEVNATSGISDSSVRARLIATTPPSIKQSNTIATDESTTPSPLRFDESIFAMAGRRPPTSSKRTLETAFPVYSTPMFSHDLDRKRFALSTVSSLPAGTPLCNATHPVQNGMDTNTNVRTISSKMYQSATNLEHSGSSDTNSWPLPGVDTRSALAALSMAYSSLFRNQVSSGPNVISQTTSVPNPLRISGPDAFSRVGRLESLNGDSVVTAATQTAPNTNVPLKIPLPEGHGTVKFPILPSADKSALSTGKASIVQPCPESLPPAISNLLSVSHSLKSNNWCSWQMRQYKLNREKLKPVYEEVGKSNIFDCLLSKTSVCQSLTIRSKMEAVRNG